jgi:quinol monooxygenase YgiN
MLRLALLSLLIAVPAFAADEKEHELITKLKKAGIKGPFTLVVTFQVKKGGEKTLLAAAKPCIAATRKEKGCITYEMSQDVADGTKFIFYERWKSPEALAEHLAAEHTKKLVGKLPDLLDGVPTFGIYKGSDD